jgi:hypothetical protein
MADKIRKGDEFGAQDFFNQLLMKDKVKRALERNIADAMKDVKDKAMHKDNIPGLEGFGVSMGDLKKLAGIGEKVQIHKGPSPQNVTTGGFHGKSSAPKWPTREPVSKKVQNTPGYKAPPRMSSAERNVVFNKVTDHMSEDNDIAAMDSFRQCGTERGDHILRIMAKFVDKVTDERSIRRRDEDAAREIADICKNTNAQKDKLCAQVDYLKHLAEQRDREAKQNAEALKEAIRQRDDAEHGMKKLAEWVDGLAGVENSYEEAKQMMTATEIAPEEGDANAKGPVSIKQMPVRKGMYAAKMKMKNTRPGYVPGQEVYDKFTSERFVLISDHVPPTICEAMNPIPGKKQSYTQWEMPVSECWLVQTMDGSKRILLEATLTGEKPKSKFSFEKTKTFLTSQALANAINLTAWITLAVYLASR